jgi:hypothetical protein
MIKGLISGSWKRSKDATIAFIMAVIIFWGVVQLVTLIFDKIKDLGPTAVTLAIEDKIDKRILEAEGRSKSYVDQKTLHGEQLVEVKHRQVMGAIIDLKESVDGLRKEVIEIYKERPRSTATIGGKPCGAHLECL